MLNLDFADVKSIMQGQGLAHMGIGFATGDNRSVNAAKQAVQSPLLETSINGARGVILNITGGLNMGIHEVNEAARLIQESADPEAEIIFGANVEEEMGDAIKVTVIATGFGQELEEKVVFHNELQKDSKDNKTNGSSTSNTKPEKDPFDFELPVFLKK